MPIDTTLGAVQFVSHQGSHITIPGGPGDPDGIYNAIYVNTEPGDSLTSPDTGSSFIQVVTWPRHGSCPMGDTILTYSESSNPASPHFADSIVRQFQGAGVPAWVIGDVAAGDAGVEFLA